ncbi:MAG: ADP-ribosylglycohydrolase family protein, partial [Actinomycetota bacterium]|nr:ADP-ribosylglycohydrolase family protein [Actinomycetota bacterium]
LETGREAAGASVERRIAEAVKIGRAADDVWEVLDDLYEFIGSGLPTNESVPAAFGILAAARGDVSQSIIGAINVGNDTDTVATIAGAVAGTLHGMSGVREDWYERVCEVNDLDLADLAERLTALALRVR